MVMSNDHKLRLERITHTYIFDGPNHQNSFFQRINL